jgi:hypothetical protein
MGKSEVHAYKFLQEENIGVDLLFQIKEGENDKDNRKLTMRHDGRSGCGDDEFKKRRNPPVRKDTELLALSYQRILCLANVSCRLRKTRLVSIILVYAIQGAGWQLGNFGVCLDLGYSHKPKGA